MSQNYQEEEANFIAKFWSGMPREKVLEELKEWVDWELKPLATETTQILSESAEKFESEIIGGLQSTWPGYEKRFVVSLDASNATKSPGRVLEKMVRAWIEEGQPDQPRIHPGNFRTELPDALRYRYIVNFLEDGEKLYGFILREIDSSASRLSKAFQLEDGTQKCTVHDMLNERKGGERSWKCRLIHKSKVKMELQICTQLQVAWDKKDHFLIFERKRRGLKIQSSDKIQMKHVSDQLYVVDRQLDELQHSILSRLRKTQRRRS